MTIRIKKPPDIDALLEKMRNDASAHGIKWSGDNKQGKCATLGFEGNYTVGDEEITIIVTKKPFWVPRAQIEYEIRKYLSP